MRSRVFPAVTSIRIVVSPVLVGCYYADFTRMIEKVDAQLQATHDDAVASLCDLLRIPSVSTQPQHKPDIERACKWVTSYLARAGLKIETWPTSGHPAVFAEWMGAGAQAPTVLIYGHYDVQPTGDLAKWTTPPFEPAIRDGRIYARGAADDKGQFFAQVLAVEAWLRVRGRLPVNVKLLIEGEEEIGSPNLAELVTQKKRELACDVVVVSDTPVWKRGQPTISLGTRGITGLEVKVTGPQFDLHSGMYGGSVPNPIAVLCRMLAALHDDQNRVTVPHFYDDVRPLPERLRAEWSELESQVGPDTRKHHGPFGEARFSTLERRWARPTLEFNGITGGYQGPGSNTIVPSFASAKITCRLVPDQDPDRVQRAVQQHLQSLAPPNVQVDFVLRKMGSRAYSIDADHPALRAAARAFEAVYGAKPVTVREGLTLPILPAFKQILNADTVLMGFCQPDCQAHSFDEFFDTADLLLGARTAARFLEEYARR
jgi:acetylornithine deacetylase/succinyl-diaminopimelate desuccinylase-like protein